MRKLNLISLLAALLAFCVQMPANAQSKADSCLISAQQAYNREDAAKTKSACFSALEADPDSDAAYFLLAKTALAENDAQGAINFLKKAVTIDSTNYYYASTLGTAYLGANNSVEAQKVYEKLVKQFPKKAESYVNLINLYINTGDHNRVLDLSATLDSIIGSNEVSTMARFNVYSARREWEKASEILLTADAANPSPRYKTLLGDICMDKLDDKSAMNYYSEALSLDSLYAPALFGKAEIYRLKSDYDNFFKFIDPFMGNPAVNSKMKSSYLKQIVSNPIFQMRYSDKMAGTVKKMADASPTDSSINLTAAGFLFATGNRDSARVLLERNLSNYPNDFQTNANYLSFLYTTQEWGRLKGYCDSSVVKFPTSMPIVQMKGIAEYSKKEYDAAIASNITLLKLATDAKDTVMQIQAYSMIGDMYHQKNDNAQAFKYFKKALKLNPNEAAVLNNYAWYIATATPAASKGELDKALKMSKITIDNEPDNSTYLDTYGWILYLSGNYVEARKQFQHALAYGGSNNDVMLDHYAEVLYALSEKDLAFLYWDKALEAAKAEKDAESVAKLEKKIAGRKAAEKQRK